jgi:exopolysaccharide biosynthesis polyprenyl glycosylphosphotransferase
MISRLLLGLFFFINLTLLLVSKGATHIVLRRYRAQGFNFRNMLIVGCGKSAQEVIGSVAEEPWAGYKIIGCLDAVGCQTDKTVCENVRVVGTYDDLEQILFKEVVDELVFATDLKQVPDVIKYVELADEMGIAVRILPQWNIRRLGINPQIGTLKYESFLGVPTLGIDSTPENRGEIVFKTIIDYAVAMVGMVLTLPLWLAAAIGIKIVSPAGPVLYKQTRVGQNGREFTLLKFRTMVPDADKQFKQYETQNECDGPVFKLKKDPRVLPFIGPLLRKSSLDELPQLINVLKGELSIVGPRPPLPKEVKCYQYWQRRRLSMKPGITCFWQVQPKRNEISFEEWMRMDLAYIDNWSLWLDLKIMVRTAWVMLIGAGR